MRKHPLVEFAKYMFLIILLILTDNPYEVFALFVFSTIITRGKLWLADLWIITAIIFLDSFASLDGVTYIAYHNYHIITLEAVIYGLVSGVRMSALLGICRKFSQDVQSDKLVVVTSYFSTNLSLLISMTVRNVRRYEQKFREIYSLRLASCEYSNIFVKIYEVIISLSVLLDWALENGMETTYSMIVRKYGTHKRTSYKGILISRRDIIEIIIQFLVCACYIVSIPETRFFPTMKFNISWLNIALLVLIIIYGLVEEYFESKIKRESL